MRLLLAVYDQPPDRDPAGDDPSPPTCPQAAGQPHDRRRRGVSRPAAIRQVLSTGIAKHFPPPRPPFAPAAFTGEVRLGDPGVATCRLNLATIRRALSMRPEVRCVSRSRAECSAGMTGSGMGHPTAVLPIAVVPQVNRLRTQVKLTQAGNGRCQNCTGRVHPSNKTRFANCPRSHPPRALALQSYAGGYDTTTCPKNLSQLRAWVSMTQVGIGKFVAHRWRTPKLFPSRALRTGLTDSSTLRCVANWIREVGWTSSRAQSKR